MKPGFVGRIAWVAPLVSLGADRALAAGSAIPMGERGHRFGGRCRSGHDNASRPAPAPMQCQPPGSHAYAPITPP
jgi:hypothetical protein